MSYYIHSVYALMQQAPETHMPPEAEVRAAQKVLSACPVARYPAFTSAEVRLVAMYREHLNSRLITGRTDDVWGDIYQGSWYSWLYAVHEAVELQAFADAGANPFDFMEWSAHFKTAHFQATVFELQFGRSWAEALGVIVPEAALEAEHPIRKGFSAHHRFLKDLYDAMYWQEPTQAERLAAQEAWQRIRRNEQ